MNPPPNSLKIFIADRWNDYALLDSGDGRKLERYGPYTFSRPEPQAAWQPALPEKAWLDAHAEFQPTQEESGGHWAFRKRVEANWTMQYASLRFQSQTTAGRHLGVFPEQAVHWDWMADLIRETKRPVRVLNLFGYTGLATLACAQAGAEVTHVDASKKTVTWARENQTLSKLDDKKIRWIVDDAIKYVQREIRRGSRYDGLILDPPKFGRGPKGEIWEFFKLFPELLSICRKLMSDQPLFVVLTAYAIRASALSIYYSMEEMLTGLGGSLLAGELALREQSSGRLLSMAITARWSSDITGK